MSVRAEQKHADTYQNPVYPHSFPDPFVLRYGGHYFAYATGHAKDGNIFDVLTSTDLVNWTPVGSAMEPLDDPAPFYWAPEVVFGDGKFYLYYSVGNETLMHLRVAVSDRPDGGFVDAGVRLTDEDFAIDAHVFVDDDGQRYLFYATDFLEHSHIGTGTVVDRMVDWFRLEGKPRPVTRAKYDWQIYDPERKEKGGVRWHTVEGPSVIKHKGRYYEMYSGGNWQNTSYGVSFAVTDRIDIDEEWVQHSDGETVLPLLRTVPGKIVGPGHNCIVRGPNGRELYCVYHRWTDAGRVMAIDRMDFAGERMFITGATDTPQPAPYKPTSTGFDKAWGQTGEWHVENGTAKCGAGGGSLSRTVPASFFAEFAIEIPDESPASVGIRFQSGSTENAVQVTTADGEPLTGKHSVAVEIDGRWMKVILDDHQALASGWVGRPISALALFADEGSVAFSNFSLTAGFEDIFDRGDEALTAGEWRITGGSAKLLADRRLLLDPGDGSVAISREGGYKDVDIAVNLSSAADDGQFGLALVDRDGHPEVSIAVGETLTIDSSRGSDTHELPPDWKNTAIHQFRVMIRGERALVYLEDRLVSELAVRDGVFAPSLFARHAPIALDMVRVTAI